MYKPTLSAVAALSLAACQPQDLSHPTVKVVYEQGHGSATHIGNGYFLTAAHVLKDTPPTLQDDQGRIAPAEVLWRNDKYDIALLHANAPQVAVANVDCRSGHSGEAVTLSGNPLNIEHITTRGHIAGSSREVGPWAEVLPINGAIAPGMSGGGMFDSDGDLIGVNVGVMVMPIGLGGGPVAIGYSVPSSVVCKLMGQA